MRTLQLTIAVVVLAAVSGGCGSDEGGSAMPAPVLTEDEIRQLDREAAAFVDRTVEAWPDLEPFVADLAEDATYADPTGAVYLVGKDLIIANEVSWAEHTDFTVEVEARYVSKSGTAYRTRLPGLEMSSDPEAPVLHGLEVYQFRDGRIVGWDEWWQPDWLEFHNVGCFAVDGCAAMSSLIERYVDAWVSRDPDAVVALYSEDATFTDSILGLDAADSGAIGDLADVRFGSSGVLTIEVLDRYAWTDDEGRPTEAMPDRGRLIGVTIHYRAEVVDDDTTRIQDGVATLVLGTRYDAHIDPDPEYLIHDEHVYHDPASLLNAFER